MVIKFYCDYIIYAHMYKYNFTFSLSCTTCQLTNDKKNNLDFKGNFYFQTLFNIFILTPLTPKAVINKKNRKTEKGILLIFLQILFIISFTSTARFSKFYAGNVILFQIKVNARNIKETMLAKYFIKVTARPSFTRLRDIK